MKTTLQRVRRRLGLGQSDFADYLGVSRSLLSLAEIDKRSLPDAAYRKLALLVSIIESNPSEAGQEEKQNSTLNRANDLAPQIAQLELEQERLQRQILLFQHRQTEIAQNLQRLGRLLDGPPLPPEVETLVKVAQIGLQAEALRFSMDAYGKLERKRIENQAWLAHLKALRNGLNEN